MKTALILCFTVLLSLNWAAFKVEINGTFVPTRSWSDVVTIVPGKSDPKQTDSKSKVESGHNIITQLTLRAFVTPDSKILTDAADLATKSKKPERFTITITELAKDKSVIKTHVYDDCILTSMDFPAVDAAGGEMMTHKFTFKPTRLTINDRAAGTSSVVPGEVKDSDLTSGIQTAGTDSEGRDILGRVSKNGNRLASLAKHIRTIRENREKRRLSRPVPNDYFKWEIKGFGPVEATSVSGGDLTLTIEESTRGDRPDYREYTYGSHEYGDLTFTVQTGPGMVKLQEWADKAMKVGGSGNALRRDCSLYLLARDKSTVMRTINYMGVIPISYEIERNSRTGIKTMTVTLNVARIEEAKG